MPLSTKDVELFERMEEELQRRIETNGGADYDVHAETLNEIGSALDSHYKSLRKVDEAGRVTEEFPTRLPSSVEGGSSDPSKYGYFFEPKASEVSEFLKKNPAILDRTGQRSWAEGIAQEPIKHPVYDPQTQTLIGYNTVPAKTHLDNLTEEHSLYGIGADEMWKARMEEAKQRGETIKRYRDVPVDMKNLPDVLWGGIEKGKERVLAPALMGVANAFTGGQASAGGDVLTDAIDYGLQGVKVDFGDPYGIGDSGLDAESLFGRQPRAEEVINRNVPAYVGGNLLGYGIDTNPANLIQGKLADIGNYAARNVGGKAVSRGVGGRAAAAGVIGGITNMVEGAGRDMTEAAAGGASVPEMLATAGSNMPLNAVVGFAGGGALDLLAQGAGGVRETFRDYRRNAPLRTLEEGGGSASIPWGATPPDEVREAFDQSRQNRMNPSRAPTTPAGDMAAELAPQLERSVRTRTAGEQERIGNEMQDYYNHPAYRNIEGSTKPAIQALVNITEGGFGRSSVDGSPVPMDAPMLKRIGDIVRQYADVQPVPSADAPSLAAEFDGIVVEGDLAGHLAGDTGLLLRPGQALLLRPSKVNARALTTLERRIYNELGFSNARGMQEDPVWQAMNEGIKETRDQFPLYRDEAGKLVAPPPDSVRPEPYSMDPEAMPPSGQMSVMPPPASVEGGPQRKPEGLLAVGPGQPDLPSSPFDPRAGSPEIDGVVLGQRNPFDASLPTSQEAVRPLATVEVQGEYGPPPPLDPNARMGIGPRDNRGPVQSFTDEGLPLPGKEVSAQPTVGVQGDYNKPPEIEKAPDTERGMPPAKEFRIMVKEDGQLRPVAGMRVASSAEEAKTMVDTLNSYGTDEFSAQSIKPTSPTPRAAEPELSTLEGNKLAMKVDEPFNSVPPTPREPTRETFSAGDLPAAIKQATDQNGLAPVADVVKAFGGDVEKAHKAILEAEARGAIELSPLEMDLDRGLLEKNGPDESLPAPNAQEWAETNQATKVHMEELFAPGREARAAQVEKLRGLAENPEVIEEAINQVKQIDERLGPIPPEEKRKMVISVIESKLGRKIDAEDLIRFGLISAGLVQMAEGDDESGAAMAGIGAFFGRRGKGKAPTPEAPAKPKKPTQPTAILDDGREVRGFSALRSQQHTRQEALEKAMKRLGVEGDTTLEGRIRTYGQLDDRGKVDQALLDEAMNIGKADDLRRAASANAFSELKDRSSPFGSLKGLGNALIDFFGFRTYAALEYPAGRFTRDAERNPFVREPGSTSGRIQKALLEDPARRLLNLSAGAPSGRFGDDALRLWEDRDDKEHFEKVPRQPSP